MKHTSVKFWTSLCLIFIIVSGSAAMTVDEIFDKVEANSVHKTARFEGKMKITDSFSTRVKSFIGYTEGKDNMLLEFTNIEDAGQKILRLNGEIYLYFPEAEEIITLRGEALKDRMMGSDFSYEDLANEGTLRDKYNARLEGEEEVDGNVCYKILLEVKSGVKDIIYPKEYVWIDKELFIERKAELFSLSGKMIKEFTVHEVKKVAGKYVLTHYVMVDTMKKSSQTEFILDDMQINPKLDPFVFSLEELSW